MRACLVHHADALGPDVDPLRPLSTRGLRQADRLAARAREAGIAPAVIWHSGKLRARQTAEAFLRACNPFAEFRMVRGLRPDDMPDAMLHDLNAEDRDVLLVGHRPSLPELAALLGSGPDPFPLHGLILFERRAPRVWTELLRIPADRE